MQNLNLCSRTIVGLKNKSTVQYFRFNQACQDPFKTADGCGAPPSINNNIDKGEGQQSQTAIQIVLVNGDDKAPLMFGSRVYLITSTNHYLACLADGGLKFDKLGMDQGMNKTLKTTSSWLLTDPNNSLLKKPITIYDDVVLKSVYSTFMICEQDGFINTRANTVSISAVWNIMKANVPFIPEWMYLRPTVARGMVLGPEIQPSKRQQKKLLSSFTVKIQEWLLIQDLLDIMLGFQGVYIKRRGDKVNFVIEPQLQSSSCDLSLYQLCQKLLVIPANFIFVEHYIATNSLENGIVAQALCGSLRTLIKEYKMMIIQLDQQVKNGLTLQQMWYYAQPTARIMECLSLLTKAANKLRGGPLLSCIYNHINSTTDVQLVSIYKHLFNQTIIVYIQELENWLYSGMVFDKHNQFMIQKKVLEKDRKVNEWNQRFVIIKELVPHFLQKEAQLILKTGKYLNVIQQCGKRLTNPFKFQLSRNLERYLQDNDFSQPIHNAYKWVSQELRSFIFVDKELTSVLKSIKGFFFLEFGDVFVSFLQSAQTQLSEPRAKYISTQKISSLLQLSIKTSTAKHDPLSDDIFCKIESLTIFQQVNSIKKLEPKKFSFDASYKPPGQNPNFKYFEAFVLDCKIEFPLTLIINYKSLNKYQVLFRHLFWFKYIERCLNDTWSSLMSVKEYQIKSIKPAHLLIQRMTEYVKSMMYYLFYEVIERSWAKFMDNLKKVSTFQDVMLYHDEFLDSCLRQSLITNQKVLKIIVSDIGNTIQGFVVIRSYLTSLTTDITSNTLDRRFNEQDSKRKKPRFVEIKNTKQHISKLIEDRKLNHFIQGFILNFDKGMKQLLEDIYRLIGKDSSHLVHLLARLDTHEFYAQRLEILRTNADRI